MEMRDVRRRVQLSNQRRDPAPGSFRSQSRKSYGRRKSHELVPVSLRESRRFCRPARWLQILPAIPVAQKQVILASANSGTVLRTLDSIQVRNQRNRNPVISPDTVVAADHDAGFPGSARTKNDRRLGANAGKVNRSVTRRSKETELAVRFFQEERGRSMSKSGEQKPQRDDCRFPTRAA